MAGRPRLKSVPVHRSDAELVIWPRALQRVYLADPEGSVAALLRLLSEGRYATRDLRAAMAQRGFAVTDREIEGVLSALDTMGVLEDATGDEALDEPTRERHKSNLRFYDVFSRLDRTSASIHLAVRRSRVLLLGAGGVGSGILQSLVGLGVGEVSLVDCDVVEAGNLARQFVYGLSAVGRPKVAAAAEWAAAYSGGGTRVVPLYERVEDAASVRRLGAGCDVVVCAIDSPAEVHTIVNEACFGLQVPLVAGGLNYSTLAYWSVEPGRTPCRRCLELHRADEVSTLAPALRQDPFIARAPTNRAIGPVAQLLCGLMSMEVLRYLTRIEPPVAAATYQVIELADRLAASGVTWEHHPGCPLCHPGASAVAAGAPSAAGVAG